MPFVVRMSKSEDEDFPVIAEKIEIPRGTNINWDTEIRFEDGIQGFITIDRRYIRLTHGRTIAESYEIALGRRLGFFQRPRNTEFAIYAYRQIITGCSVGGRFGFTDLEDEKRKEVATFWNFSLRVDEPEQLVKEAAVADNGKITTIYCSQALRERGNLHGILEQVVCQKLREVPFSEIRSKNVEISNEVIKTFRECGGSSSIGFDIESFTLGDIRIAE